MARELDRFSRGGELVAVLGDWTAGDGPLYRKLADAVAHAVDEGALAAGHRLPSERELAKLLAVSRATVVAAYEDLEVRELLERKQGSGTRISAAARAVPADGRVSGGRAAATFQRLIDGPGSVISLACAADAGVPEVAEALEEVARYDLPSLLGDPGYQVRGLPALREAVADYYTGQGLPTAPDEVMITTGAHQALVLLSEVYLRGAATVAVEAPSWQPCLDVFRDAGAGVVPVPLDDEGIDERRLAAVLAEHRPSVLYVMPTFHNPAGVLMSDRRRRRVAELAARYDVAVIEDNAYAGCALARDDAPEIPAPLSAYLPAGAESVVVESLKAVWGGLRIGWIRGPRGLLQRCARRKALADLGGPLIEQAVAARLFPRLPEIVKTGSVERAERCDQAERLIAEHLPGWTWRTPDGGSSLWLALPERDADVFAQIALRHGVEVIPGSTMDPTGAHDNYLRLPFMQEPEVLDELVRRLADAWGDLVRHGPGEEEPRARTIV